MAQRDAGKGVLLVSLELDEVMALSYRILVMYEGEIVGQLGSQDHHGGRTGPVYGRREKGGSITMKEQKRSLLRNGYVVQLLLVLLLCILIGLLVGYVVLLLINPAGAGEAISTIVKNFMTYSRRNAQLKYLGSTLVKTAPLLTAACLCSLPIKRAFSTSAPPDSMWWAPAPACIARWRWECRGMCACWRPLRRARCWAPFPAF